MKSQEDCLRAANVLLGHQFCTKVFARVILCEICARDAALFREFSAAITRIDLLSSAFGASIQVPSRKGGVALYLGMRSSSRVLHQWPCKLDCTIDCHGPLKLQTSRVRPGLDSILNRRKSPTAGRHNTKDMAGTILWPTKLHSHTRVGDIEVLQVIMENSQRRLGYPLVQQSLIPR
jgi:hypothetical protein